MNVLSSWGDSKTYTPDIIGNSQKTPTEINKNGAIAKVRVLQKDIQRHLEQFLMKREFYFDIILDEIFKSLFLWANAFSNFCDQGRDRSGFLEIIKAYKQ